MGWKFFLPDRFIAPVELKIHEIAGSLIDRVPGEGGLVSGKAGVACFYAYYDHWTRSDKHKDLVQDWIGQALNPPARHYPDLRFSSGMAGVAWMIHHLSENMLVDWDVGDIFDELDEHLYSFMITEMKSGHFDYLHGALGLALYFLRQPRNEKYRRYIEELVAELEKIAEEGPNETLKWASPTFENDEEYAYNLSLSHGMSSIILILSKTLSENMAIGEAEHIIRCGLGYMGGQKLAEGEYISTYPPLALESMKKVCHSRLAWCYGDIGPGLAFYYGGNAINSDSLTHHGMEVLLDTCIRRDLKENLVYDAGICHGASGLALVYNILYQRTAYTQFREAAVYWLDVTLSMSYHKDGIAGYKAWNQPEMGGWKNTPGLLDGTAGIGLVLMSFLCESEPGWTNALLLN